jgi:pimeloyl-ACP methyl ester carboxylesterase
VALHNPTSMMAHRTAPIAVAMMAVLLAGCIGPVQMQRVAPVAPFGRNDTLIYVPGIGTGGGGGSSDAACMRGLRTGGYQGNEETFDWTGRLEPVAALWAHRRHREQARHIADRIRTLRLEAPTASIILVGHSAGAGLVVLALEDLPPTTQVDGVVLLAPALSRTYNLTAALRHVRGRMDVFCSDRDTLVLGVGTFLFATVDGVHDEAAGLAGFVRPDWAAGGQYAKLHTHHFSRTRQSLGDDGGHFGCLNSNLAAALVAPLLPRSQMPPGNAAVATVATQARSPVVRPSDSRTARAGPQTFWGENSPR